MPQNEFTVTQLNEYVNGLFKENPVLSNITVSGEISGYVVRNQHRYFTLKDEGASIDCALFAFNGKSLTFEPKNGDKVLATGSVGIYVVGGKYQLYVKRLQPQGMGELYVQFEQLKKQLQAEGLFAAEAKQPLPMLPRRIGIVTSPEGAAIRDMIRTITNKFDNADILLYPAVVQGKDAHFSIIAGIEYLDAAEDVDVIIIGRGGGSMEDLWCFNEEALARAVYAAKTPIVSAVGHESDFTIADFVADARAATPTAAAELVVPDKASWLAWIDEQRVNLTRAMRQGMERQRSLVELKHNTLLQFNPESQIQQRRQMLDNLSTALADNIKYALERKRIHLQHNQQQLESLNPKAVLQRGYAIVQGEHGVVSSKDDVQPNDKIEILVADGTFGATVE